MDRLNLPQYEFSSDGWISRQWKMNRQKIFPLAMNFQGELNLQYGFNKDFNFADIDE